MNIVVLKGKLSRAPQERVLPSGDRVVAYEVTTRSDAGAATTAPVAWRAAPAAALRFDQGDDVVVLGEVRRRYFCAGGSTQSRTEVVAEVVVAAKQRAKVAKLLERAATALAR